MLACFVYNLTKLDTNIVSIFEKKSRKSNLECGRVKYYTFSILMSSKQLMTLLFGIFILF
jgi:hypothetical protein